MAFWDKWKKKAVPARNSVNLEAVCEPSANTGVSVLFERVDIDKQDLEKVIVEKFGREALVQVDDSHQAITHFMIRLNGLDFLCSYMPFAFSQEEVNISELLNWNRYISEEERNSLVNHQSFCMVTQIGGGKTLEGKRAVCLFISKLCGALLTADGAAGVYCGEANLLIGKSMYLRHVAIIEQQEGNQEYFPAILWVLVGASHTDDGAATIETYGLEQFGFMELVFYKPTEEWAQSYEKLYLMAIFQITEKELYKNMDTISFTQDSVSIFKQSDKKLFVIGGI